MRFIAFALGCVLVSLYLAGRPWETVSGAILMACILFWAAGKVMMGYFAKDGRRTLLVG